MLDVFNALDRQAITNYDQRYNLDSQSPCAGISEDANGNPLPGGGTPCGAGGGLQHGDFSLTPVAQLPNARATATNPDFLRAGRNFTEPRTYRLGVRFRF